MPAAAALRNAPAPLLLLMTVATRPSIRPWAQASMMA
jgi:hypothetical protein